MLPLLRPGALGVELKFIATVRCLMGVDASCNGVCAETGAPAGCEMSWVPGLLLLGDAVAGAVGVGAAAVWSSMEPITCWKAPRCESAPLTASGDTFGPSPAECDFGGLALSARFSLGAGCPESAGPEAPIDGGPAADRASTGIRESGDAVDAKGLTCDSGALSPFVGCAMTMFEADFRVALGGVFVLFAPHSPLAFRTTGAPQAAQNFADPTSSALHLLQIAMGLLHVGSPSPIAQVGADPPPEPSVF